MHLYCVWGGDGAIELRTPSEQCMYDTVDNVIVLFSWKNEGCAMDWHLFRNMSSNMELQNTREQFRCEFHTQPFDQKIL